MVVRLDRRRLAGRHRQPNWRSRARAWCSFVVPGAAGEEVEIALQAHQVNARCAAGSRRYRAMSVEAVQRQSSASCMSVARDYRGSAVQSASVRASVEASEPCRSAREHYSSTADLSRMRNLLAPLRIRSSPSPARRVLRETDAQIAVVARIAQAEGRSRATRRPCRCAPCPGEARLSFSPSTCRKP